VQLDSDDENEPQNNAADPSAEFEADPDSLEDGDVDIEAPGPRNSGDHACDEPPCRAKRTGPRMAADYKAWLAANKADWRARRLANRQVLGGEGAGPRDGGVAGLGQGMQRQMAAMMHATWQIVQVCAVTSVLYLQPAFGLSVACRY
jgi:hypothetical protein